MIVAILILAALALLSVRASSRMMAHEVGRRLVQRVWALNGLAILALTAIAVLAIILLATGRG